MASRTLQLAVLGGLLGLAGLVCPMAAVWDRGLLLALGVGLLSVAALVARDTSTGQSTVMLVFALALGLRLTIVWGSPSLLGVDPWFHVGGILALVNGQSISALGDTYRAFPGLHVVFAAIDSVIGTVDWRVGATAISCMQVGVALLMFREVDELFGVWVSLPSAVFVLFSPFIVRQSYLIQPTSIGVIIFGFFVWLVLRNVGRTEEPSPSRHVLALITFLGLLVTHTLSTLILLAFMWLLVLVDAGARRSWLPDLGVFSILVGAYWFGLSNFPYFVLFRLSHYGLGLDRLARATASGSVRSVGEVLLDYAPVLIALAGLLYTGVVGFVDRRLFRVIRVLALFGSIGLLLLIGSQIALRAGGTLLLPERWYAYEMTLIGVSAGSVGLALKSRLRPWLFSTVVPLLVAAYVAVGALNYQSNPTLVHRYTQREALSRGTVEDAQLIKSYCPDGMQVDWYFGKWFKLNQACGAQDASAVLNQLNDGAELRSGTLVLRKVMFRSPIWVSLSHKGPGESSTRPFVANVSLEAASKSADRVFDGAGIEVLQGVPRAP